MIPIKQEYKSEGNLLGQQQIDMTLDEAGTAHIISLLSDMYEDSELAVIRELSCNAIDSHRMAGVSRPIEITLPSYWNSNFIVKDYGLGLNVDELAGFYSKVGASTKRDTNEATGMFGIGRIAPLPYAGTFTVTAIQNGVKAIVLVKYNDEGVPVVEIIDTVSTDESNGLEVSVPVKQSNNFDEKCEQFFKYWTPGTVLINGEQPDTIFDTALKVDEDFYIINDAGWRDTDVIVMGGVPYSVEREISDNIVRSSRVVVFAALGEFSPVPSRESLRMTDAAKTKIDAYTERFKHEIVKQARLDVETAPTGTEAVIRYNRWSTTMYQANNWDENLQYNGHDIVSHVKHTHMVHEPVNWDQNRHIERTLPGKHTYVIRRGSKNSRQEGCEINQKVLYVVADPMPENITNHRKRQALALAREKMGYTDKLYIVPELVMPWMDDVVSAKWEDVENYKIAANSDGSPRKQRVKVAGKYEVYNEGLVELEYDPYKKYVYTTDKKLFNNDVPPHSKSPYPAMYLNQNDYVVIYLGKNRVNKFLQQFPTALVLWAEFQRLRKEEYENLDTELLGLLAYDQTHSYMVYSEAFGTTLSKVDDPTVKAFGESIAKYSREDIRNAESLVREHDNTYRMYCEDILAEYPLVDHRSLTDVEVEMINALYYYRKEKV